jgi:cell division protein FtsL
MNKFTRIIIWFVFLALIAGNIYIFVSSIHLSDEINRFEADINRVHQENIELEKKVFKVESLQYTASLAAQLDFTKKSAPIVLDNTRYALNQ